MSERCVCAPQYTFAGTSILPMLSDSTRVFIACPAVVAIGRSCMSAQGMCRADWKRRIIARPFRIRPDVCIFRVQPGAVGMNKRPIGVLLVALLLLFGTIMGTLAAVMLFWPGSFLEPLWRLNPQARYDFAVLGRSAGVFMM